MAYGGGFEGVEASRIPVKCHFVGNLVKISKNLGQWGGGGGGVWAMAGVQGRVAFGLRHFCILSF